MAARFRFTSLFSAVLVFFAIACGPEPTATATAPSATLLPTASTPIGAREPAAATPSASSTPTPTAVPTLPPHTPTPTPTPEPSPTTTQLAGLLVSLPEDEAPHDTPVEWWYFNGFLWDDTGSEYSFHYVTFQSPSLAVGTPHLLHATLSDHAGAQHTAAERGTLAALDPDAASVNVNADGWVMWGDGEGYALGLSLGGATLDLQATSRREVVLHDYTGLVNLGQAGETYYYSRTRIEYEGWIEDKAGRREVSGSGWMDHQWGDISRVDVGWDWINLHLGDGSDLMVAIVWKPGVQERTAAYATFVTPDGDVTHVPSDGVALEAKGHWVSPETGIKYPMGWLLAIAPLDVELELAPVLEHAEFAAGLILPVVYWEGAVTASGQRSGIKVEGRGFVELVGYDPDQATANIPMP